MIDKCFPTYFLLTIKSIMVIFFLYKISFCALKKNCVEREQPSYKILSIEARSALYPVVVALKKTFDWARMVRIVRMGAHDGRNVSLVSRVYSSFSPQS